MPTKLLGFNKNIFLLLASLALLLFAFRSSLSELFAAWQTEEYSHGFIIPVLALFIGLHLLAQKKPLLKPSWLGVLVILLAGCLLLVGRLSAFEPPVHYGLLLALVGLSLTALGRAATRVLAPAFIYLLFAIPLPRLIFVALSQDLQLLSSTLGVFLLDVIGIPVYQEGNVIDLGGSQLQVVEACSGLRYLFPLMSFGFLLAFLLDDRVWKRALVFLSTIPIAIGMNALRIFVIGITVHYWGNRMAEGFLHDIEGWSVFLICIFVLMVEIWVLKRIGNRGRFRFDYFDLSFIGAKLSEGEMLPRGPLFAGLAFSALLALLFGAGVIDERSEKVPAHPPFASFPLRLGDWVGKPEALPPLILNELQLSDYWLALYIHPQEPAPVEFYMAYYNSQRVQTAVHSPANCIPGGGWQIAAHNVQSVALPGGKSVEVSRLVIRRAGDAQLVYYWFEERGRDLTEQYGAKWFLLWDSIFLHRTDGALVRLTTPFGSADEETAAAKRLDDFLVHAYPQVKMFIPGAAAQ